MRHGAAREDGDERNSVSGACGSATSASYYNQVTPLPQALRRPSHLLVGGRRTG
jgi:hypothetical protein